MKGLTGIARQVRKVKKLATPPTEGQKKIEKPVKEQRAYAKGQAKAALTVSGLSGLSIIALRKMLKDPESRAIIAKASGGNYNWAIGEEADQI